MSDRPSAQAAERCADELVDTTADPGPRYLCKQALDPESLSDPVRIDCALQVGRFASDPGPAGGEGGLKVAAWNLERGMHLDAQIELLRTHPDLRDLDLLLVSEADRACTRTQERDVSRELARALELEFAFATQYVELPRPARNPVNVIDVPGELGNALMARGRLHAPGQLRHSRSASWREHKHEPRIGGCVAVRGEVDLRDGRRLRCYSVHFDSMLLRDDLRVAQVRDVIEDARAHEGPVLIAGDMNSFRYTADVTLGTRRLGLNRLGLRLDPTVRALEAAGYTDAHAGLRRWQRGTTSRRYVIRGVIDLIWTRGLEVQRAGVVQEGKGLSDHLPVWAEFAAYSPPSAL